MSYLKSKDGSLEASIKEMQKNIKDSAYQDMFKKELEKAGKGIGAMSPQEKKDFFNKIDKMHKAKNEDLNKDDEKVVNKVKDMLKGASAKHAAQAKMLDKAMKTEAEMPAGPDTDQMQDVKKMKSKDPKAGEKMPMKMNKESLERTIWKMAADELEEMKKNSKYINKISYYNNKYMFILWHNYLTLCTKRFLWYFCIILILLEIL